MTLSATSGGDCWGQSFGNNATPPTLATDALANLFYTSSTKCSSPAPQFTGDGSNHISTSGFSYDSAGNNTADAQWSYTYDAENRIATASGMSGGPYCYIYDADGVRVSKAHAGGGSCTGSPTVDVLYWRNIAGNTIAETDSAGSTSNSSYHEYVFFAGRRVAESVPSSSSVYYYFVDHLGSTRSRADKNGSVCFKMDYLPYGAENTPAGFTNSCSTSYKFTGYERDAETGLDYAFARYYSVRLQRFLSADPLAGNAGDPQSLNRYAYVRNNPINFTDPTGTDCVPAGFRDGIPILSCTGGGGGSGGSTGGGAGNFCVGCDYYEGESKQCRLDGFGCNDCNLNRDGCYVKPTPRPVVRADKPSDHLPSCYSLDWLWDAISFETRLGVDLKLANVGFEGGLFKVNSTGQTGMSVGVNLGVFGGEVSRTLSPGNSGADASQREYSGSFGPIQHNFTTKETSGRFSILGLAVGLGFEVSLNFNQANANAAKPCTVAF